MSEAVQRQWRFYLDDMIAFAEKVLQQLLLLKDQYQ